MKPFFKLLTLSILLLSACGKTIDHHSHDAEGNDTDNPNQALYDQVMDIHDEVMPKMQNIYQLKKDLLDKIANATEEEKKAIEQRIAQLDSVDHLMMDWMHKFNPLPDSVDQEEGREYLESEMEKIKKVKEAMLEVIEKEKGN